jgi:hypothetical protein
MKPSLFRLLENVSQNTKGLFRVSAIQDHLLKRTSVGSFPVEHIRNDVPEFDRDMVLFQQFQSFLAYGYSEYTIGTRVNKKECGGFSDDLISYRSISE